MCRQVVNKQINWQVELKKQVKEIMKEDEERKGRERQLYTLCKAKIGVGSGYFGGPVARGASRGEVLWGLRLVEKLLPLLR